MNPPDPLLILLILLVILLCGMSIRASMNCEPEVWRIKAISHEGKVIQEWETKFFNRWKTETTFTDIKTGQAIIITGDVIIERIQ
jgi:hypothetical protein